MKKPHHLAEPNCFEEKEDNFEIFPRGLNIVWGDDPRYWSLETSTNGAATLIQVSWLDVSGMVEVKQGKKYRVTFEVMMKPDAFGWTGSPVLVMAKVGKKGKYTYSEILLSSHSGEAITIPDGGVEVDLTQGSEKKIYFGLYEVWSGKWKGGLMIKKAKVEPVT
ncbi:protein PHLOEM PROTEIN 2-LIKE A9 isoform X2 [Neltuma alba]|uniref:protein PHLOEM PROTEIN 2-LIKE A9 isoform X2 n=1 Tax=Neltuma alba TaxID=207710 RepID=UPI0010A2E049|nr:protein PHLOEM PROTEIN 2-LIKE A9-like isoform X2 [Prosopis alba]XP_028803248.1 protein PHLOEM PROTEIN 2-LIKE A9 isoform X2 [Prosopis alba]